MAEGKQKLKEKGLDKLTFYCLPNKTVRVCRKTTPTVRIALFSGRIFFASYRPRQVFRLMQLKSPSTPKRSTTMAAPSLPTSLSTKKTNYT